MNTKFRQTKIIVTLGKASSSVESLVSLINAGIDAARITTRFLNSEVRTKVLENLREAERITQRYICVILSLREGDIRIGNGGADTQLILREGDIIRIVTNKNDSNHPNTIFCNNPSFPNMVTIGDKLLVEFGKAIFTVVNIEDSTANLEIATNSPEIKDIGIERLKRPVPKTTKHRKIVYCRAENDYKVDNQDPLNFLNPNRLDPNQFNNFLQDVRLLEWAGPMDLDIIIYKEIRDKEDLEDLWSFATPANIRRFVGIQTKETAENPDLFLDVSAGCSIGRGILGVETSHSRVCSLQKKLVQMCNAKGKPVFISTQVLESMVFNDKPSRAEVVDSYCAVIDGADALMLTGETAYGKHPELAVKALHRICVEAEQHIDYKERREMIYKTIPPPMDIVTGICYFAAEAVEKIGASLIVCLTNSGNTALTISKFKPSCMIAAFTNNLKTLRYLRIVRGVYPILLEDDLYDNVESAVIQISLKNELVQIGDTILFVGSSKDSIAEGTTSSLRILIAK
jgi:pyruvate kinase